ncbi:MAG: N-6 DNA methylase [Candidatus Roizmanbacteria bacterium]
MNADTKRHIDTARQILVGVVPNPTSQIDQITNALIYKFMDDMDQASIKVGGEPSFFTGIFEKYSWSRIMDSRMGNQERMNLYSEALVSFSQAPQLPQFFRDIFKSAFLPYRSPEVLGMFLKEINYFDYSHSEELGNAYEYLLSVMSSQGDAGQFRTPRHIIDFIVAVVNPTKNDTVLDPACGTAGFLISSYKHILAQHDKKGPHADKEVPLTPAERKQLMQNFQGYDIDPGMVRISQVNMYLHQFKNPQIFQYDSLSMEDRWNDKFDVVLANPPFMSPKGGIKPHSKFSVQSSRSEVLFVDYIVNHLRPNGRAGIIVPEGIIFQSGTAYKELRKNLVQNGLYAVVSLPSGVFNPYAGVKTSILLFDNVIAKQSKDVLFIKISNDGYDLGAQRRKIDKDDLPDALKYLTEYRQSIISGHPNDLCHSREGGNPDLHNKIHDSCPSKDSCHSREGGNPVSHNTLLVPKSDLAQDGDYNLSGDRYRVTTDYTNAKWPMVELGEVATFIRGITFSAKDHATDDENFVLVATTKAAQADGIHFEDLVKIKSNIVKKNDTYLKSGDILISVANSANLLGRKTFIKDLPYTNKYSFGAFMGLLRPDEEKVLPRYLDAFLDSKEYKIFCLSRANTTTNISNLNWSDLQTFKIPLPPLEVQKQIVTELDGYQAIITGARQVVQNWKPKFEIDQTWEKVKLGDVCDVRDGTHDSPKQVPTGYPLITSKNIIDGHLNFSNVGYISEEDFKKVSQRSYVDLEDIIMPMIGTIGGACLIKSKERDFAIKNVALFKKSHKVLPLYLLNILNSDLVSEILKNKSAGATQKFVSLGNLRNIEIPLPPLPIQHQIVEKIEAERALVEGNKKLIQIYEQKMKDAIAKVWEE